MEGSVLSFLKAEWKVSDSSWLIDDFFVCVEHHFQQYFSYIVVEEAGENHRPGQATGI
jgi:hypothetical protein